MPFRVAADVPTHLPPVDVGMSPGTLRAHTLKIGEQPCDIPAAQPVAAAMSITVTTHSTFIRSCDAADRHLKARVGNIETSDGGRQVLGAVASSGTGIAVQLRRRLEAVGRTAGAKVTAFADGCPGLQSILADAGVDKPPPADRFHIAMRLRHAKLAASGLSTDAPGRKAAKATIVTEVGRLHWRKGQACLPGRARSSKPRRGVPKTVARASRDRRISAQPEHPTGQPRRSGSSD